MLDNKLNLIDEILGSFVVLRKSIFNNFFLIQIKLNLNSLKEQMLILNRR